MNRRADHLADVPAFELLGVVWRCWVVENGNRYLWRSECGRLIAGRNEGRIRAAVDGKALPGGFETIRQAMAGAIREMGRNDERGAA